MTCIIMRIMWAKMELEVMKNATFLYHKYNNGEKKPSILLTYRQRHQIDNNPIVHLLLGLDDVDSLPYKSLWIQYFSRNNNDWNDYINVNLWFALQFRAAFIENSLSLFDRSDLKIQHCGELYWPVGDIFVSYGALIHILNSLEPYLTLFILKRASAWGISKYTPNTVPKNLWSERCRGTYRDETLSYSHLRELVLATVTSGLLITDLHLHCKLKQCRKWPADVHHYPKHSLMGEQWQSFFPFFK